MRKEFVTAINNKLLLKTALEKQRELLRESFAIAWAKGDFATAVGLEKLWQLSERLEQDDTEMFATGREKIVELLGEPGVTGILGSDLHLPGLGEPDTLEKLDANQPEPTDRSHQTLFNPPFSSKKTTNLGGDKDDGLLGKVL